MVQERCDEDDEPAVACVIIYRESNEDILRDMHHPFILDPFIVLRIFITVINVSCNTVQ